MQFQIRSVDLQTKNDAFFRTQFAKFVTLFEIGNCQNMGHITLSRRVIRHSDVLRVVSTVAWMAKLNFAVFAMFQSRYLPILEAITKP